MRASTRRIIPRILLAAAIAACASSASLAKNVVVQLNGSNEVPPVATAASGQGTITINDDATVTGSITTTGVSGTAAHIHVGAEGGNGPVALPLARSGEDGWSVPPGSKLSDAHYRLFQAGELYVNVHSAKHPDGEIRGQLKP
jgi:hypothetical protein